MATFYADEDFDLPVVDWLRSFGHDVLTADEDGRARMGIEDDKVLDRAIALDRTVLTRNRRHFHRLHWAKSLHAGIVTCTWDGDFHALAVRIHTAVIALRTLSGELIRITRPSSPP